jgi:hypothetical protein
MTALHKLAAAHRCNKIADLVLTLPLDPAHHSFPMKISPPLPTWIGGVARSFLTDYCFGKRDCGGETWIGLDESRGCCAGFGSAVWIGLSAGARRARHSPSADQVRCLITIVAPEKCGAGTDHNHKQKQENGRGPR